MYNFYLRPLSVLMCSRLDMFCLVGLNQFFFPSFQFDQFFERKLKIRINIFRDVYTSMIDCAVPCNIISYRSRNKGGLIDKSEKHFLSYRSLNPRVQLWIYHSVPCSPVQEIWNLNINKVHVLPFDRHWWKKFTTESIERTNNPPSPF